MLLSALGNFGRRIVCNAKCCCLLWEILKEKLCGNYPELYGQQGCPYSRPYSRPHSRPLRRL